MGDEHGTPVCFLLFCEAGLEALVAADARRAWAKGATAQAAATLETTLFSTDASKTPSRFHKMRVLGAIA